MSFRNLIAGILAATIFTPHATAQNSSLIPIAEALPVPPPLADHHQHLVSTEGADWLDRTLPPIALPPELNDLLKRRSALVHDKKALAELFTADAVLMGGAFRDWLQGPSKVADYLAFRGGGYVLTPTILRQRGKEAQIFGYFSVEDEKRHMAFFTLTAVRQTGGDWKISSEVAANPGPRPRQQLIDARQLVAMLDAAGIRKALVLSTAFWFDSPSRPRNPNYHSRVRAENDWTAEQVRAFPGRLIAFCSFNPLEAYALTELRRCIASGAFKGIKLHFGSSGVDLSNPDHVYKLRRVFTAANEVGAPILVHTRTYEGQYGPAQVRTIVDQLFASAPGVPITVAHLWGGEAFSKPVLDEFSAAVREGRPGTSNLTFDISDAALVGEGDPETLQAIADGMRKLGLERMLFGSDAVGPGHPAPLEAWQSVNKHLPLSQAELRTIASNVAPYLR